MGSTTAKTIEEYNKLQVGEEREICEALQKTIDKQLIGSAAKLWHGGPVWFLKDNPIVGYSKVKAGIKLMFWSGADFKEPGLIPGSGKFKDASTVYTTTKQVDSELIKKWLEKAKVIQWDYKNIVKRRGELVRL